MLKSRGFRGDVVTLAKALRKSYKARGNIGVMADYFSDKGARVISAIEGTMGVTDATTPSLEDDSGAFIISQAEQQYVIMEELGLTYEEQRAILEYKSSWSYVLNQKVRLGIELSKNEKNLINLVDSALKKIPTFKGTVYRNIGFYTEAEFNKFISSHPKGELVTYSHFTSTSKLFDAYTVDCKYKVHCVIDSKNGHDVENIGIKEEHEVLFSLGTSFEVVDVNVNGNDINVILKEINSDEIANPQYNKTDEGKIENRSNEVEYARKHKTVSDGTTTLRGRSTTHDSLSGEKSERNAGSGDGRSGKNNFRSNEEIGHDSDATERSLPPNITPLNVATSTNAENMSLTTVKDVEGDRVAQTEGIAKQLVTDSGRTISYSLEHESQSDVMWTLEEGVLNKREVAMFYQLLGELERGIFFPQSSVGDYIFDVEDKLVYADDDYLNPTIFKVITFNTDDIDVINYCKEIIINEEEAGVDSDAIRETLELMQGKGIITSTDYVDSKAYRAEKDSQGKGRTGKAVDKTSRTNVNYSLEEYWHPDLSKKKLDALKQIIKRDIQTSTRSITDTANWLATRIDGVGVFAIYSTENTANPTLLYESKGKKAEIEKNILLDILEEIENAENLNRKSAYANWVSGGGWMQKVNDSQNHFGNLGRRQNNQNAGVLQSQSKRNGSPAFWSVLENLFEIQEGARRGNLNTSDYSLESEDNYGRERNLLHNDIEQWYASEHPGEQVAGLAKATERGSRTAQKRKDYTARLKKNQLEKKVITDKHGNKHLFFEIKTTAWNEQMNQIADYYERKDVNVHFIRGNVKIYEVGEDKAARAMRIGNDIYISYDNSVYTPEQLSMHEYIHIKYESPEFQKIVQDVLEALPKREYNKIVEKVKKAYGDVVEDPYAYEVELICDVLSGMTPSSLLRSGTVILKFWINESVDIFGYDASQYAKNIDTGSVRGHIGSFKSSGLGMTDNEYAMVSKAIMAKNAGLTNKDLKPMDYVFAADEFYIFKNHSVGIFSDVHKISIVGQENLVNDIRGGLENGTYRRTASFALWAARIRSRRRSNNRNNGRIKRNSTNIGNDRLSFGKSKGNAIGHSSENGGNTTNDTGKAIDKVDYSLEGDDIPDFLDLWNEHIETYGAIPKGEKPAREIDVPKKISEDEPVSYFARTMMEAGVTPDDVLSEFEQAILDGEMSHEVIVYVRLQKVKKNKKAVAGATAFFNIFDYSVTSFLATALITKIVASINTIAMGRQIQTFFTKPAITYATKETAATVKA